MATTLSAILSIVAKTTGEGAVNAITGAVKRLENTSKVATGTLKNLAGSAGGLGGALGMLAPALSVGGLVAMATNSIKGADAMNDLAQKTGVSVEALARFKKAAAVSGTDIEGVSKALLKLSKGMYEVSTTGKGPAADAFKTLGLSVTDAAGKLKTGDQMMIEVANKFKAMPDGVEKTALALQLFGKAGADMIPMLNMGGEAIDKMKVKMTAAFAKKADEYSDKLAVLQGKIGGIGTSIAIALLPALDVLATVLTTVVDVFTKLPEPLQAIIGGFALLAISAAALAPFIIILGPALTAIGAAIGAISAAGFAATIAGWLGALGPVLAGIASFATAIVGWPLLIGVALVAIGALIYNFRGEIAEFFGWVAGGVVSLISSIGKVLLGVTSFMGTILSGLVQFTIEYYKTLYALFAFYVFAPIKKAWVSLISFLGEKLGLFIEGLKAGWSKISATFTQYVSQPITNAWNAVINWLGNALSPVTEAISRAWGAIATGFTQYVTGPISKAWSSLVGFLGSALNAVTGGITRVWTGMVDGVKGALRGMLQFAANALNGVIGAIRAVIDGINKARAAVQMGPIAMPGFVTVPAFAAGGVVSSPTLAMVGEAGREYIIPEAQMAAASSNYLAGSRGASVLSGAGGGSSSTPPQINITTGPVLQTADGQQWVSLGDLERAQRQTVEAVFSQLRTASGRNAVGVR